MCTRTRTHTHTDTKNQTDTTTHCKKHDVRHDPQRVRYTKEATIWNRERQRDGLTRYRRRLRSPQITYGSTTVRSTRTDTTRPCEPDTREPQYVTLFSTEADRVNLPSGAILKGLESRSPTLTRLVSSRRHSGRIACKSTGGEGVGPAGETLTA